MIMLCDARQDVLALEFVENIDDVMYALSRRGFFGKTLKRASYQTHAYDPLPGDVSTHTFAKWMKRFVRLVYFFNGALMLFGLTVRRCMLCQLESVHSKSV